MAKAQCCKEVHALLPEAHYSLADEIGQVLSILRHGSLPTKDQVIKQGTALSAKNGGASIRGNAYED